jgi:hypothetical protein
MVKIGGYESMKDQYMRAVSPNVTVNDTCGLPDPYAFHMMRPADDPAYPWPGVLIGANILSAWNYCTDQGSKMLPRITTLSKLLLNSVGIH